MKLLAKIKTLSKRDKEFYAIFGMILLTIFTFCIVLYVSPAFFIALLVFTFACILACPIAGAIADDRERKRNYG